MKFKCYNTKEENTFLSQWHPYYPWRPRMVDDGTCRCFEWIERKGYWCYDDWEWEYRLPPKS